MIAEIALGAVCVSLVISQYRMSCDQREERRLLMNRETARSIPELAALQHITKAPYGEVAAALKKGLSEPPERNPRAPTLPMGL